MSDKKVENIDEYIENYPEDFQKKMKELRQIIREAAPEATEKMSWQMPTFYLLGNMIHFAAHKKHIGLYPGPTAVEAFSERLREYKTSKGAIQIPIEKELDKSLIQDLVRFSVDENIKRHEKLT